MLASGIIWVLHYEIDSVTFSFHACPVILLNYFTIAPTMATAPVVMDLPGEQCGTSGTTKLERIN
jgi:hypothetical protein